MIGLNLCPFAKAVHVDKRICFVASSAQNPEDLLVDLKREMQSLMAADAKLVETTILVHAHTLQDFLDFNDFLELTEDLIDELDLRWQLQIATFHP
ncbi:MAG: DUF1415 family protein [Bdellovibrionales bacterium]|nr:DUF1415 family protein [Bdellovibrionales bacterium]